MPAATHCLLTRGKPASVKEPTTLGLSLTNLTPLSLPFIAHLGSAGESGALPAMKYPWGPESGMTTHSAAHPSSGHPPHLTTA